MTVAFRTLRSWHAPLACFTVAVLVLGVVSLVGLVVDHRVLVGVPIWAKPLKFSVSFALYAVALAWMLSLVERPRLQRVGWWAGTVLVVASVLELGAIVLQVLRGQQSHFNVSTPFDAAVFDAMGGLVVVIFLATVVVAVVVARSPVEDRSVLWAVRLGLVVALAGLSVGFLMVVPTAAQLAQPDPVLQGAHSVGVLDGGPHLPLLGWSTTGGDLRVPHFLGMHALQGLPLLALWLRARGLPELVRVRLVLLAAAAWASVVALTLWQAERAQPLLSPDATTLTALALLVGALVGGGLVSTRAAAPVRA